MTGNTVLLGIAVASHLALVPSSLGIVPPLLAVATFVVGAAIAMPAFRERFDARRAATVVLAEAIVVAIAAFAFDALQGQFVVPLCIALVSLAMGAQSIVASKAGLPGISTTYITGTLVTAIIRLSSSSARAERTRDATHDGLAWIAYLGGAIAGSVLLTLFHRNALLPPVALFVVLAAWFWLASIAERASSGIN